MDDTEPVEGRVLGGFADVYNLTTLEGEHLVTVVEGNDDPYQASWANVSANWDAFDDPHSGIMGYYWSAGFTPGVADIVPWTWVGHATQAEAAGPSAEQVRMANANRYYVAVQAVNYAGLSVQVNSDRTCSAAFV